MHYLCSEKNNFFMTVPRMSANSNESVGCYSFPDQMFANISGNFRNY